MKLENLKNRLQSASKEKDKALRGIRIAAVISEVLKSIGIKPTLVGGSAVAFYTEGKYTTQDIDMIAPSGKDVEGIMSELGFTKLGKDYTHKKLKIYVEFPSEMLGSSETADKIDVDKISLNIISIEDLIVDRLCAFKFWNSAVDGINSLIMLELGAADRKRLEDRAREEDVIDALDYIESAAQKIIREKLSKSEATALLEKYHQ